MLDFKSKEKWRNVRRNEMNLSKMTEHLRVIQHLIEVGTLEAQVGEYHYTVYKGGITVVTVSVNNLKLFEISIPDVRLL